MKRSLPVIRFHTAGDLTMDMYYALSKHDVTLIAEHLRAHVKSVDDLDLPVLLFNVRLHSELRWSALISADEVYLPYLCIHRCHSSTTDVVAIGLGNSLRIYDTMTGHPITGVTMDDAITHLLYVSEAPALYLIAVTEISAHAWSLQGKRIWDHFHPDTIESAWIISAYVHIVDYGKRGTVLDANTGKPIVT